MSFGKLFVGTLQVKHSLPQELELMTMILIAMETFATIDGLHDRSPLS